MDAHADLPEVRCHLELDASLQAWPQYQALVQQTADLLQNLLANLGIPGWPMVEVLPVDANLLDGGRFLRLLVNGSPCAYPDELLQRVLAYLSGTLLDLAATPEHVRTWLDTAGEAGIRFLALACLEIVKLQPSVLLGEAQARALATSLAGPPAVMESARLQAILGPVVDLWISLADRKIVSDILARAGDDAELCEALIAALSADAIEVNAPQEYQARLASSHTELESELVNFLREGLFIETGLWLPRFIILSNRDPHDATFSFKLNHLTTCPHVALGEGECLVNDTAERLKFTDPAVRPVANPATGQPAAVVDFAHKEELEAARLTTWDSVGYLILTLAAVLRTQAACLVHTRVVQDQLKLLGRVSRAPADAVLARYSLVQITRTLRDLAADGVPLRDLTRVLEAMLEYAVAPQRELDLVAFARSRMARAIGNKHARGTRTLVAYLLDPKIESALAHPLDESTAAAIIQAVRRELKYLPATAQRPVLLTDSRTRPILRDLLQRELPFLSVVAYDDLLPSLNIQPVARILLT